MKTYGLNVCYRDGRIECWEYATADEALDAMAALRGIVVAQVVDPEDNEIAERDWENE